MKNLIYIAIIGFLASCGGGEKAKPFGVKYNLTNPKDKVSFAVGANQALMIAESGDPNWKNYDKEMLAQGFEAGISGTSTFDDACKSTLSKLFGPQGMAFKPELAKEGSRCVGVSLGSAFMNKWEKMMGSNDLNIPIVVKGCKAALGGFDTLTMDRQTQISILDQVIMQRAQQKGVEAIAAAKAIKGAKVLPSGVVVETLKEGSGPNVPIGGSVTAHYILIDVNGDTIQSSYDALKQGQPVPTFSLLQVIPAWTNGIPEMKKGGKYMLYSPSDQAYGPQGNSGIPPNAFLRFYIEVVDFTTK